MQGRRKQLRIGGADRVALREGKKILLINIHEEGLFHTFTRIKMAVRLVFADSVCSSSLSFTVSSKLLQLYLYCSVVSLTREI